MYQLRVRTAGASFTLGLQFLRYNSFEEYNANMSSCEGKMVILQDMRKKIHYLYNVQMRN